MSAMKSAVFLLLFALFLVLSNTQASAFDFSENVASHFFWTKSYKAKHPKPVNNMPKTMADYYRAANKAADDAKNIPSPRFPKDAKIVDLPDPSITLQKYNNPPGHIDINLVTLKKARKVNSIGVVSPDFNKMVYTVVYYYPSTRTVGSELYLMNLDTSKSIHQRVETAHINQGKKLLYRTGLDSLTLDIFKTLTIIDWSVDGKRLALKEKISFSPDGLWKTNLLVYDFETGKIKNLSEVREAIQYYWREKHDLYLRDYRWDIYPLGWDALNPERIIVLAYAATGEKPKFLGTWSVDYKGDRAMLVSLTDTNFQISQNGSCLKATYD